MVSRCSDARDRTRKRSEWSSETRTGATRGGYRRTPATSIRATRTVFSVGTAGNDEASLLQVSTARHRGYLEQPRNWRPLFRRVRRTMGERQVGHSASTFRRVRCGRARGAPDAEPSGVEGCETGGPAVTSVAIRAITKTAAATQPVVRSLPRDRVRAGPSLGMDA
jgi:hypothetical protein